MTRSTSTATCQPKMTRRSRRGGASAMFPPLISTVPSLGQVRGREASRRPTSPTWLVQRWLLPRPRMLVSNKVVSLILLSRRLRNTSRSYGSLPFSTDTFKFQLQGWERSRSRCKVDLLSRHKTNRQQGMMRPRLMVLLGHKVHVLL